MIRNFYKTATIILVSVCTLQSEAWDLSRIFSAGSKAMQAITLTDAQMSEYVHQSVEYMDKENKLLESDNPYSKRLSSLTQGLTQVDGIPLNFKVYETNEVNAFACADGSVRVYTGIMDLMSDDELLGVIGHEIGHVAKHHSKKAFQTALLNSAFLDGLASTSTSVARLTDSQLGQLSDAYVNAKFSRKQENEADEYGYKFLKENGKNPWAMALAFQKLLQLENQQSGSQTQSYITRAFSSHPDTQERIQNIVKKCKADQIPQPGASTSSSISSSQQNDSTKKKEVHAPKTNLEIHF